MMFSAINTFIYCIPASWAWNGNGWLAKMGFFDFAGAGVVHMTGGASALVAAMMLGPRLGRFSEALGGDSTGVMSSPVTALTGTFMLWWAWLAFNCGSTFGIASPAWKTAAKIGVTTLNGSIGGSMAGLFFSIVLSWKSIYFDIGYLINSILGGLVGITAACAVIGPAEAIFIGFVGGSIAIGGEALLGRLKIDDPVGATPVHFGAAIWGVLAVGLFGKNEFDLLGGNNGLFFGGGFYLLGIQALGILSMASWSMILTGITFFCLKVTMGIRMEAEEEILGADWVEHRVKSENFAMKLEKALGSLKIGQEQEQDVAFKVLQEITKSKPPGGGRKSLHTVSNHVRNFAGGENSPLPPRSPGPHTEQVRSREDPNQLQQDPDFQPKINTFTTDLQNLNPESLEKNRGISLFQRKGSLINYVTLAR